MAEAVNVSPESVTFTTGAAADPETLTRHGNSGASQPQSAGGGVPGVALWT